MIEPSDGSARQAMQLTLESDPVAVRNSLATLLAHPILCNVDETGRGTAEIVLAEILNNIVEHAYARNAGEICVNLHQQSGGIYVVICDRGQPFPQGQIPHGTLPKTGLTQELPEGGFGWFLIRNLVQRLTYTRQDQCNQLSFLLPLNSDATTSL